MFNIKRERTQKPLRKKSKKSRETWLNLGNRLRYGTGTVPAGLGYQQEVHVSKKKGTN